MQSTHPPSALHSPFVVVSTPPKPVLWLVTDHGARNLGWQRCALGLLAGFGRGGQGTYGFQFRLDGSDVRVDQIFQQATLGRTQLLAALGELVPFEQRNFVGELFVSMRWIFLPIVSA